MILNKEEKYFEDLGAGHTAREINQEPTTWKKTCEIIKTKKNEINSFLQNVFEDDDYDVILTGAGTSEFVGNSIYSFLNTILNFKVKSYATTDLVATPKNYLHPTRKTLLVSFARSGNSPESVGTVNVANAVCKNIFHLFITCNKEGELSKLASGKGNCLCINLPDETCDKSFAMTSSFSCMYLACILTFMQYKNIEFDEYVNNIVKGGEDLLHNKVDYIENIVKEFNYQRIVYLGSNGLKGVSQESALKTCELTAGTIMTSYDSSMGFRHGPKSVVKNDSLSIVYISDNPYTRKYDADIAKEIAADKTGKLLVVSNEEIKELKEVSDYYISFNNSIKLENVFLGLEYILVGQLLSLFKSMSIGNTPDNPCSTGQVFRVVKGVNIYSYSGE